MRISADPRGILIYDDDGLPYLRGVRLEGGWAIYDHADGGPAPVKAVWHTPAEVDAQAPPLIERLKAAEGEQGRSYRALARADVSGPAFRDHLAPREEG